MQQTEIGDKTDDYAEKVWLQIQAVNPFKPSEIQDTRESVGIVEYPHAEYAPATKQFYDGNNGNTKLDDSGKIGGAATGVFVPMSHGVADVLLHTVADARFLADGTLLQSVPYNGPLGALLRAVPSGSLNDPTQPLQAAHEREPVGR